MKMALNNSISDRDALREQQRQARALMMDTNDSPINPGELFAGPICRVSRPSDDPLGKKIQKTLGEYDTFKETISLNPKNLIGITSQPATPLPTSGGRPHFVDALKPAKPPYANGFKVSGSAQGHHNSSSSSSHQHRGSSGSSGGSSRSNSAVSSSRGAVNGWSGQTKAPPDGFKPKGFKPPSPPAPYPNHLGGAPPPPPPTTTLLPDGLSEKASKPTFHPQTLHHSSSSNSSLPPPSGAKINAGSSEHLVNGHLFNGVVKAVHNRSVSAKPNLRVNIEEAQAKVPDQELENILKEMIAPTPLTAIPTPRKDETKFAFSAVLAPTPHLPLLPPTSLNSSPPSVSERNSVKSVSRSLEKPFAALSAPSTADKQQQQQQPATHGIPLSLIDDLDVSESDDDEGTSGRKACASSQVSVRSPASGHQPPSSSVPLSHALPAAPPILHNSDSDNSDSSSASSSEPEPDTSDNEEEEVVVKPASPLNVSGMNWGLDNFMVTSPTVPFGLPSESTPVTLASSDSSRSSSHRHHRSGSAHSTNKTNVCDLGSGSRRGVGRTRELPIGSDDDNDDDAVPALLAQGTSHLASPSSRGALGLLTSFPRNNEAFSRIIDKDVPVVSPPLSPSSPPHAPPSRSHSSASSRSTSAPHATKMRSSLSPRSRSPATAPLSSKDRRSGPGRPSKESNPAAKKVLFSNSNTDKYGYTMTPIEVKTKQKSTNKFPKEKLKENEESSSKKDVKAPRTPPSPSPPPSSKASSSKPSKGVGGSSSKTDKKLAEPKEIEAKVKNKQKSPCGRKQKSATKYTSKAIISDDDSDIDVGGSSPVVSVSKSPAVRSKSGSGGSQGLSKNPHFSSSTSLSSAADSVEDVSTATGTLLSAKVKHDSSSRHSTSSSKKSKNQPPPPAHPKPSTTPSVKSENGGSQAREALKSKSKPNKIASGSGSGPDEWMHVPAPLSPISKDDFKEAKSRVHNKNQVKFPSLVYRDGVPSLLVSLDKNLLDRLPIYPPQQLRLTNDACAVVKSTVEEKKKNKKISESSEPPPVKVKQQQLMMAESGKENRTDGNHSLKSESKVSKRPLQEPEARKSELKKLKSSSSSAKEKNSSVESLNQFPQKTKTGSVENVAKVKKEILEVEEKGSPAPRSTHSPAYASSSSTVEKKVKKSSAHKISTDMKRDKKHSSSNSTLPIVKKSNRESEALSVKIEENSEVKVEADFALSTSSSLTTQNLSKEVKQRGRSENLEVPDSKKRKWSGSNSSITSQTNSVTDSQKVNKTEGIERNTNHDRIVANQDFHKSSSVPSSSSAPNFNSSKDLLLVLNRINDIVDLSRHSQEFYVNHAKKLKHDADQEADRTTKALKYLHAVVYFSLSGIRMETDPNHSHSSTFQMFGNTSSLVKYVSSIFRSHQSTNVNSSVENKGAVLSLWCQSSLNFKLYNMKRNEVKDCNNTISEYQKTPTNPASNRPGSRQMTSPCQSSSNAIPPTMWSKSNGAPSPMSPLPSPANSVGSVESQSSGYSSSEIGQPRSSSNAGASSSGNSHNSSSVLQPTVSIPVHLHSIMQKQLVNLGHLYWTHELWDQAESLIVRGGNQEFFSMLDEYCGKKIVNPMISSIHDIAKHVLLGLHFLGQKMISIS